MKTFNGEVFSDFRVRQLPARAPSSETRGGKRVYKTDGFTGLRVGAGGPEIEFDTLNGNIRILRSK